MMYVQLANRTHCTVAKRIVGYINQSTHWPHVEGVLGLIIADYLIPVACVHIMVKVIMEAYLTWAGL